MKNQNYKLKYQDLKLKFMDAVDVSFRLGFEQGTQQAQIQQVQQDQQAQQQAQQQPGQEGQPGQEAPGQEQSDGSELDQHIGSLESMLSQSKPGSPEQAALQKSLAGIKEFRFDLKQASDLKKSESAIKAIAKAMKPKLPLGSSRNMSEHGKKALSDQQTIVDDLMKSFAEEEKKALGLITNTLNFESILKG